MLVSGMAQSGQNLALSLVQIFTTINLIIAHATISTHLVLDVLFTQYEPLISSQYSECNFIIDMVYVDVDVKQCGS